MMFIKTLFTVSLSLQMAVPAVAARITLNLNDHSKVTPIQKVLEMMSAALAKGKKEKNIEEVEFAKFKAFCEDVISDTTKDIAAAAAKIEQLNADILKAESDAKILGDEVAALEAQVATEEKDLADATAIRKKDKADYEASHADYSESIDAIERAIAALKKRAADIPQSLLQVQNAKGISPNTKALIESFIEIANHAKTDLEAQAPEANAYENQSGGIVAMLEKLLTKFEDELFALEKEEMNLQANFDMLAQKLTRSIKDAKTDISQKTAAKAQRLEDAATAKGDLEVTTAGKMEDEKTLSDTKSECYARSDEYEKNQVTRKGEIEAITKAMEILSSPAVSGNAEKHLPSLAQTATSLLQVEVTQHNIETRQRVVQFLQSKAQKIGSRYLLLVASRAAGDPFKKVKKMIKDMIVKLMEEANAEAEHKGFCDTELATNKQTRDIKSEKVDELTASIEEHTAEKEKLATEISELSAAIAELKQKQAEATALRDEEKTKNLAVIKDAQDGQKAVEMAIKVLKDFYDSASGAAFLQAGTALEESMKQATKAPYEPGADGGIMGMLDVILSDFARLEAETQGAEDAAQTEYEKFMADADEDNAVKQTEVDHKTLAKQRCEEKLTELKKDLEVTQAELDAALDYYEKLKPDCVDQGLSYEDRVARRKEEIVSLQEALKILSGGI
jgi:chromosome segregation ATPase